MAESYQRNIFQNSGLNDPFYENGYSCGSITKTVFGCQAKFSGGILGKRVETDALHVAEKESEPEILLKGIQEGQPFLEFFP